MKKNNIYPCLNGRGRISLTSTSNTRKIIPIMKNFIQKLIRELPIGSKPHSKGLLFSLFPLGHKKNNNIMRIIVIEKQKKYMSII